MNELTRLAIEYKNDPIHKELQDAMWDLAKFYIAAAASNGHEESMAYVNKHDLKFSDGIRVLPKDVK